jgi:hypothetical protein
MGRVETGGGYEDNAYRVLYPSRAQHLSLPDIRWYEESSMKKTRVFILVIALVAALIVVTAVAAASKLTRLTIVNRTDQNVALSLIGSKGTFYLPVAPGTTRVFTLDREVYKHTTFACGKSETGTVDMSTQLRLVFPSCYGESNNGAPTLEKVKLNGGSRGKAYRYQLNK